MSIFFLNKADVFDAIGSSWRLAFYMFMLFIFIEFKLPRSQVLFAFRLVGIVNAVYGILQFALGTYAKISLSPYIPLLPVLRGGLEAQQLSWIDLGWRVRARAFFSEPSMLAIFLLLTLSLELISNSRKYLFIAIYIVGIIVTTSSTGIIGLAAVVLFYLWFYHRKNIANLSKRHIMYIALAVVLLVGILYFTGCLGYMYKRTFANGQGLMAHSHFRDISSAFQKDMNIWNILFGHGLQQVSAGYLPGWVRTFYCLGVIGLGLYLFCFISLYKKSGQGGKMLLALFMTLNLGSEIMVGIFILPYVFWIVILNEKKQNSQLI